MNKRHFVFVATLAFATVGTVGCSFGGRTAANTNPADVAVDRIGDKPYVTGPGDTLAKVAVAHGIGFGELFVSNERILFEHWQDIAEGGSQTLEEALLKLEPDQRVKVASALAKPPDDWLASDKEAVADASHQAGFQFGKQASVAAADGLGEVLGAGTVLVVPPGNDAPKDVREYAKQAAGDKIALVFYTSDEGEHDGRTMARWFAQGLRMASKKIVGVVVVNVPTVRVYDDKLNVNELSCYSNEGYLTVHKPIALAAALRPEGIVLLTDRGEDEWSDDDEVWAKGLPPVTIRLVSKETDEPDGLTRLAKASKGKFIKVDK